MNHADKVSDRLRLGKYKAYASIHDFALQMGGFKIRKHKQWKSGEQTPKFAGCLQAIHYRHRDIQNHEFRTETPRFFNAVLAIDRFKTSPSTICFQCGAQSFTQARAVIDDENPLCHTTPYAL